MKKLWKRALIPLLGTVLLLSSLITTSVLCAAGGTETVYQPLKVGIMSDIHLYDTVTGADENLKKMLELYKENQVDATSATQTPWCSTKNSTESGAKYSPQVRPRRSG